MATSQGVARNTIRREILQRLHEAAGRHQHPFSAAELATSMGQGMSEEFMADLNSLREQGYVRYEKSSNDHRGTFPVQLDSRGLSLMENADAFNQHFPKVFHRDAEWTRRPSRGPSDSSRSSSVLRRCVLEALSEAAALDPGSHVQQVSLLALLDVIPAVLTPLIKMLEHEGYLSMTPFLDGDYTVQLASRGAQLLADLPAFDRTFPPETSLGAEPGDPPNPGLPVNDAGAGPMPSGPLEAIQQRGESLQGVDRQAFDQLLAELHALVDQRALPYQGCLAPFAALMQQNTWLQASLASLVLQWLVTPPIPLQPSSDDQGSSPLLPSN